ncbi:MAG: imidazole glycerol phosphate synthase subunit HisH [Chitinophagaceae bacterium]|nr:imidazole glycerol phosphate synthase subunit HisH [Chitinophagaceae bacterium]
MITIVDFGSGNLGSIQNMLKKIGVKSNISSDIDDISQASKIILPGVGSFDTGIQNLQKLGITETLNKKVLVEKVPILGICLGMQLMCKKSAEGKLEGLSWFNTELVKFDPILGLRIPHMNWAHTAILKESPLFDDLTVDAKFYHVHSYHVSGRPNESILESCYHGFNFVSALQKDNIIGVQFHPEKSHKFGMIMLRNFVNNF